MYKLYKDHPVYGKAMAVHKALENNPLGASVPFDPANTDYANFKKEVLEGAELQDADGVVMSADAAKEFVRNLP